MPIAVSCQCGKTLNVRDELAGKAVKCPACQQVIRVPAQVPARATANPPQAGRQPGPPSAARPATAQGKGAQGKDAQGQAGPAQARPTPGRPAQAAPSMAAPPASSMDHLFEEAGFSVKTGKFCPSCSQLLLPGAVLCINCGYHVESGMTLERHKTDIEEHDGAEAVLRKADENMKKAKAADLKLQNAGMPAWMMAMILFVLASCTAVAVIAVNVSRRSKDSTVSFNAVATMLLLGGIAFAALYMGSQCLVIYRAFKESPKQGMLVLLAPFYVFYYGFSRFQTVGKAFILCIISLGAAIGLFVFAGMSNSGRL